MNHQESKNQFSGTGINSRTSGSFHNYNAPTFRSFTESKNFELPQFSQMSSIQKSKNFVESHSTGTYGSSKNSINEMKSQQRSEKHNSQSIPVIQGSTSSSLDRDKWSESSITVGKSMIGGDETLRMTVAPVQNVQRASPHTFDAQSESRHEEKTVTIKRKITRHKKGSDKVDTLRNSYIDKILSPLPDFAHASDSDDSLLDASKFQPNQAISEIIPSKQAVANQAPPTIVISSQSQHMAVEEPIVPQKKKDVKTGALLAFLERPAEKTYSSNDETIKQTFISEIQTAPTSTYSARRENMRSQQLSDEQNMGSRTLQSQGNIGHRNETTEEIETITLQPIGKGVQDLSSGQASSFSRPVSRSTTPKIFDRSAGTVRGTYYREENKQIPGYNTVPAMPRFGKSNSVQNPVQTSSYDLNDSLQVGRSGQRLSNEPSRILSFNGTSNGQRQQASYNTTLNNQRQPSSYNTITNDQRQQASYYYAHNDQRPQISMYRTTNEQAQQSGTNRMANIQTVRSSYGRSSSNRQAFSRGANEQVINSSLNTRTDFLGGENRAFQSQMSPGSIHESIRSNIQVARLGEDRPCNLQMVLNTEEQWYQPHYSREEVINSLRNMEPGSFIIRNSTTFEKAFGLAMKVATLPPNTIRSNDPQGDLVRHFLIETVEDSSGSGVRLKGFNEESLYPSLAHFVYGHCQNAVALPLRLILPSGQLSEVNEVDGMVAQSQYQNVQQVQNQTRSNNVQVLAQSNSQYGIQGTKLKEGSTNAQLLSKSQSQYESNETQQQIGSGKAQLLSQSIRSLSSPGVNFTSTKHANPFHQYHKVTALYLGKVAIDRLYDGNAIEHAVDKIYNKPNRKTTTVEIQLDSTKGLTLNDKLQKFFYTRQIPAQHVLYAGFDPKEREFTSTILQNNGINRGRIIGIVVRKQNIILKENAVHLFCEIDNSNSITDVITFVNGNYRREL